MKLFEVARKKALAVDITADSDLDSALKACKKNILHSYQASSFLFRGFDAFSDVKKVKVPDIGEVSYVIVPPRTTDRVSLTGTDFVMNYASTSPAWKDVPKRNRATSCTKVASTAREFSGNGKAWIIIPFDNVGKFAYCTADFNYLPSPIRSVGSRLIDLSSTISSIADGTIDFIVDELEEDMKSFSPAEKKMLGVVRTAHDNDLWDKKSITALGNLMLIIQERFAGKLRELSYTAREFVTRYQGINIYDLIVDNLTPEYLGIKVVSDFTKLPSIISGDNEIWFNGGYVALRPPSMMVGDFEDFMEFDDMKKFLMDIID